MLTRRVIPSLANSVEGNRLLFEVFPTRVIKFSIGNCMRAHIMVQSTVDNCYYGNISALLRVELCRVMQGLHFVIYCAVEIMGANACFFAFLCLV